MFPGEFYSIPRVTDPLDANFNLDSPLFLCVSQIVFHLVVSADCEVNLMILAYVLTQFSPESF